MDAMKQERGLPEPSGSSPKPNDEARRFLGTWRLVATTRDGQVRPERGPHPLGVITYHESGWMSAQIQPDRPASPEAGRLSPGDEALAALDGYTAYFGSWSVDPIRKVVCHHRVASVRPGWSQAPVLERAYEFLGDDRIVLRPIGTKNELVWERL